MNNVTNVQECDASLNVRPCRYGRERAGNEDAMKNQSWGPNFDHIN
jgi:hypothetical protein